MEPTPHTEWSVRNILNALVVAALSAGILACHLYADTWPKPTAIISLGIIVFASILRLPISSVVPQPTVNAPNAETVTQINNPASQAVTDPPPPPTIAAITRNPHGQFAKRVTPVDTVSDS